MSVIIPAYNAERYIAETVQSVFAQTYRSFEVIVVDDGSTDKTLEVLKSFEPRIKVFAKPNGGPASARNLGIKNSVGEYIAFLDSDDLWVEDKLEQQIACLDNNPGVGLIFSEALMFIEKNSEKSVLKKIGYTDDPTFRQLLFDNYIPNSTVIIRRSCTEKVGLLNESRGLIAVEDYEYWMRIAKVFSIIGIPKTLAYHRIRNGNLLGDGGDKLKGLELVTAAISEVENLYPRMWEEYQVDRNLFLARLQIRAGFAWKQRGHWRKCLQRFAKALTLSRKPKVFRWIAAATLLRHWS